MPDSGNALGGGPDSIPAAASHSVNGALNGGCPVAAESRWPAPAGAHRGCSAWTAAGARRARTDGLAGAGIKYISNFGINYKTVHAIQGGGAP